MGWDCVWGVRGVEVLGLIALQLFAGQVDVGAAKADQGPVEALFMAERLGVIAELGGDDGDGEVEAGVPSECIACGEGPAKGVVTAEDGRVSGIITVQGRDDTDLVA